MHEPAILILAAGASSRMRGGDKLMEMVGSAPQIARITRAAIATGAAVTVVLPPGQPQRRAALAGCRARVVVATEAGDGMAASLRAGLASLPADLPVMLLLADLPEITAEDLRQMLAAWRVTPQLILRAKDADDAPGHPVCFPVWARPDLEELSGDQGARAVLLRHAGRVRMFALPDHHATTDLDTPEDWLAWRAGQGAEPPAAAGPRARVRRPSAPAPRSL